MFKGRIYHVFAIAGFLLVSAHEMHAQTYDAFATVDSVTVGQRFQIQFSIDHDGERSPLFPLDFLPDSLKGRPFISLGDFTFTGEPISGRRRISQGWVRDSLLIEAATFSLDSAYVSSFPLGLYSESDTLMAGSPPVFVAVVSLVPDNAEAIRDITDIAVFPKSYWAWILFALALLSLAGYLYWRYTHQVAVLERDTRPEPAIPPFDEAVARLKALKRFDLSDPTNAKPFYVELSELLRNYLMRRDGVPALELTTRELIDRLHRFDGEGLVNDEIIEIVRSVLNEADLVKFADIQPRKGEGDQAISRTLQSIQVTEQTFIEKMEQDQVRIEEESVLDSSNNGSASYEP